jgi:2-keto-4-pentenoate hydratase/2-oxohepta-3-ene-1,7-dioic acid hydratase in catechol pathway
LKTAILAPVDKEFLVPKIVCVGRNYVKHIQEMKAEATTRPLIFLKPSVSIVHPPGPIHLPHYSQDIHHEVEVTILIGDTAKNISERDALSVIAGVGIGIDLTARDVQALAKKGGSPWTAAKAFDDSAPISHFLSTLHFRRLDRMDLWLEVNGELRQKGNTKDMIYGFPEIISYISTVMTLEEGDIIFTGTPEGVAAIHSGDLIRIGLDNQIETEFIVE